MLIICRLGVVTFPKLNMLLKPRFFDKFSLDKELCSKVGHVGHEQGKLLLCTAGKENLSIQANVVNIVVKENLSSHTHEQTKLIKETLRGKTCSLYTRASKTTMEVVKENLVVCGG